MTFQTPWWLLALLVVAALVALYVVLQLRRKAYTARVHQRRAPRLARAQAAGVAPAPAGLRVIVALALLALALASRAPRSGCRASGRPWSWPIDVSLSMQANDVEPNRSRR